MARRYYEIIGFKGCPWCARAYELLTKDGHETAMVWMERDGKELLQEKLKRDWATVPMVTEWNLEDGVKTEKFIGGYTDLCVYLEEKSGG